MTDAGDDVGEDRRRSDPGRVMAFTDGVFAIIITILVLEISVPPDLTEQSLRQTLEDTGPELVAWVISFLITGMYWVWHRDVFTQVRSVDRQVVWLNLLFLLPVGLIPFASSMLGAYSDDPLALHVYGAVLVAASVGRLVLYRSLVHRPDALWQPTTAHQVRIGTMLALSPIVIYLPAMAVAVVAPRVSLALYLAVPMLYFLLITVLRRNRSTSQSADGYS